MDRFTLPRDQPDDRTFPLAYTHEVEAGVVCRKDGTLAFVEADRGFGVVTLWIALRQDDADSDIEIASTAWGTEAERQALTGSLANAAEDYLRLSWGDIEDTFAENASTDWERIFRRGAKFIQVEIGRAA